MKKLIIILAAVLSLSACSSTEKGAAIGATAGAIGVGLATNSVAGAAIGAIGGAVVGTLLGKVADKPDKCYYRGSDNRVFVDDCPQG
jgi:hypothetical protein